ncbi:helicase-related protein [Sphingobacterium thalpophilum]|uniref:Helicase conserved C-terminal domain n=1 Tax=Sphingobacterium thalpophilum TaxID=259 RepID=A0A4V6KRN4_9SPHI|nr:helicase-related protein [Sphingobacterium thalpophilum]VTR43658.1 Helicase conserved C-terminal domain [Sphingobacterium thalpophilum]
MSVKENRDIVIERVQKEIIGPGSDLFHCKKDFSDEIIEGKPLQRYFSGILFPKQLQPNGSDNGEQEMKDEDVDDVADLSSDKIEEENKLKEVFEEDEDETDKTDTQPKYTANTFFPSHFGITFAVKNTCKRFKAIVRFGNYIKAKPEEIKISYGGDSVNLLSEYGLNSVVSYDEENKTLSQTKKLQRTKDGKTTAEYQAFQDGLKAFTKATSYDHALYKTISKLFFKDKYKRNDNKIEVEINIADILSADNQHIELKLSEQLNVNTEKWSKEMKESLVFHLKLYPDYADKYYIRAIVENKSLIAKGKFSLSKEKVNQLSCFQTEIRIESEKLLPFRDYKAHLYKTDEDRMLDYLYRDKLAFGIGHNTACTWENAQSPNTPQWIQSTFLPEYDVKSQSSETDKIRGEILNIKNLSVYNTSKDNIISNLSKVAEAYKTWIEDARKEANKNELGLKNITKCEQIYKRISNGIRLLSENENALRAFQLANTAIYLQMFQTAQHFSKKKEGFEVWERNEALQHNFDDYDNLDFPSSRIPEWRPFQLAFILQCLASFVDENSTEKELIDLLYFPTGGGKTEAYLAVSAFLIFWRRINYSNNYGGVNIIIRYTLRLLSAQQFERASKMILACEFIRSHYNDLGDKPVSIGFWVGNQTIPNTLKEAETKLKKAQEKLNTGENHVVNPFQLSNCQWCNTKIISRLNQDDKVLQIGHRVGKANLQCHCLNDACHFSETKGGLPVVLIDEDIYNKPPTVLFATVDKFAMLAWKGEATTFFNNRNNRKPELIIQDELHLLNGTLGSLVGLFENALLKLCDNPKIIASTATVKNVDKQIQGLYGREARVFPQYATNADDTFFSKVIEESKRKYIGILPTGKTTVVTNLQLLASLLFARLEIWKQSSDKKEADNFWTILSYFKSLKEIGRFSNKINSELKPIIKQLQVRYLNDDFISANNYNKLSYRNIELTSRIPNEKIKKNLDLLEREFDGNMKEHTAYDLVLATNMISVGLDVGRLGVMVMNGMPPNTAEYIQASSRVARKNEGLVITLYDPFNTRDLSYYEDFVQFHKTFYKQVQPLSVTPFAENALEKMLFTLVLAYFRHTTPYTANDMANALIDDNVENELRSNLIQLFTEHKFAQNDIQLITEKIDDILREWRYKLESNKDLKHYYWKDRPSLIIPIQEKKNDDDTLIAMQSMRSVEPTAEILIKQY